MSRLFIVLTSSLALCVIQQGCNAQSGSTEEPLSERVTIVTSGKTIAERFSVPHGFQRVVCDSQSFGHYLRHLPLHPDDYQVHYYDGRIKSNTVYCAVVDQDIDPVDLQQCADAVMRLRGEYLFEQKQYKQIAFAFVSDGKLRYFSEYANGNYSYTQFRKYMKYIFSYANTASLKKQLTPVGSIHDIQIGDVLIQSGNPYGHAVIVVDLATDASGRKKMMLAQSYMPAQETQILINPLDDSAWFDAREGIIETPEWTFHSNDLRRF